MVNDSNRPDSETDIPRERAEPRPDYSKPLPRRTLSKELQGRLESEEESGWSSVYDGKAPESTESNIRYAAYATRVRTILLSAHRYVAYTSDIGESFRPIAHPYLVKGAYGISWAYLIGDVSHEGYKAYIRNQRVRHPEDYQDEGKEHATLASPGIENKIKGAVQSVKEQIGPAVTGVQSTSLQPGHVLAIEDYRTVMVQRAIFQGLASMGLPAFTIHSIVKYAGKGLKNTKNVAIRTWGPIGLGLAAVPALPYMFDEPVEKATEWVFHKAFETIGGPGAVGHRPEVGRTELQQKESKQGVVKEKEL